MWIKWMGKCNSKYSADVTRSGLSPSSALFTLASGLSGSFPPKVLSLATTWYHSFVERLFPGGRCGFLGRSLSAPRLFLALVHLWSGWVLMPSVHHTKTLGTRAPAHPRVLGHSTCRHDPCRHMGYVPHSPCCHIPHPLTHHIPPSELYLGSCQ